MPKPTIEDLLASFSLWQECPSGYNVTYLDNNKSAVVEITKDELAAHEARLVPMLEHWFSRYSTNLTKANMGHTYIVNALRYWNKPLVLVDTEGVTHDLAHIDGIKYPDDDEVMLEVSSCIFDVAGDLKYVSSTRDEHLFISAQVLNQQFPGWRQRYDIYESLGLENDEEFGAYVFDMTSCDAVIPDQLPHTMV